MCVSCDFFHARDAVAQLLEGQYMLERLLLPLPCLERLLLARLEAVR